MKSIRVIFAVVFLLAASFSLAAQNDKKNDNAEYKKFLQQRNQEYKDWRAKANAEYSEYLRKAWEEFTIQREKTDPMGAVPDKPTYYNNSGNASSKTHGIPAGEEMTMPARVPSPGISASYSASSGEVAIDFFGLKESIPFDSEMRLSRVGANEKDAANSWTKISLASYMPTIDAIIALRDQLSLSDWAVYMLIKHFTEAIYSEENINERVVTQMFILSQLQYKVRMGASGDFLVLLLPFQEPIYQVSYVSDNDVDFYIFSYNRLSSQTPLFSFKEDFSKADNKVTLKVGKPMSLGMDYYEKIKLPLWSAILGEDVSIPVNSALVSMTLNYPQSDLITYHRSAVDKETAKAIFRVVKYKILKEGMNQEEAVAYILNLIQKGFEYKTDFEMFGRSKPLFIEESIYYGSNNCKDRVLVFSWLVKNTLDLNTVMFGYPGHVACGVEFNQPVSGDYVSYQGHNFVMCDPTYIGAPIGATMPKFKDTKPTVTAL